MDDIVPLVARWAHILSAIVALGGSVFMRFALMPACKSCLSDEDHEKLRAGVMKRWQKIVHTCILLFLLSGLYNALVNTLPAHKGVAIYHMLFGIKFLLALVMFFLAIALTSSRGFKGIRANGSKWLALLVTLGIIVVLISSYLRTIPEKKEVVPPAPIEAIVQNSVR